MFCCVIFAQVTKYVSVDWKILGKFRLKVVTDVKKIF